MKENEQIDFEQEIQEFEERQARQEIELIEEEKSDDDEVMTGEFFGVIKQMCSPFLRCIIMFSIIIFILGFRDAIGVGCIRVGGLLCPNDSNYLRPDVRKWSKKNA